jgi:anti-sigma factor ChrR (cupin superfamily)
MPPTHHPSAQALANFLIGDCSPGEALLITRHLESCVQCASRLQAMGSVSGQTPELVYGEATSLRDGVELQRIQGVSGLGEAVFHVRVAPGQAAPLATPLPAAEVLLLEGGFTIDGKSYVAGDFLSFDGPPPTLVTSDPRRGCVLLLTATDPG